MRYKLFFVVTIISLFSLMSLTKDASLPSFDFISIEELTKTGLLETNIRGLGGYQGDCIEFDMQNNTSDTLLVYIEAGRRLTSVDTTIQDIFLVKNKKFRIFPRKRKKVKGYGFCCQSSKHAPYSEAEFNMGYLAPDNWILLAEMINKNNFPAQSIQDAIWVLSDNHEFSSINAKDLATIQDLRQTIAEIKNIKIPWYTLTYTTDTAKLFSNRPEQIVGNFNYRVKNNSVITISIKDKKGQILRRIVNAESKGPGEYEFKLNLNVLKWEKGEYAVYVYQDYSKLISKKVFIL